MSLKNPEYVCPKKESFHFGMLTCAYCLGRLERRGRLSAYIWPPVYGDQAETEILIPGGRQSFHRECLESLKKEEFL